MHQPASDLHHSIGIEIKGADFDKIDKVLVTGIHTYIHTYQSDVIGPPSGVQLAVFQARLITFLIEEAISRISGVQKLNQHFPN